MSLKIYRSIWVALILILGIAYFQFAIAKDEDNLKIPAFTSHIVDTTSWLSSQEVLDIKKRLDGIKSEGNVQIAVLIVDSVKPLTIQEYSLKVAEVWKIGKKGVDNGALILIAKSDKKARIEVGYGLEGDIPDAIAKRIVSDFMAPYLTKSKPHEGITIGIDEITNKVNKGDFKNPNSGSKTTSDKKGGIRGTGIKMIDNLPTGAMIFAIVLGIISAILFYTDEGGFVLAGLIIPFIGGGLSILFYSFITAIIIAIGAIIFAVVIRFGGQIGGEILSGGGDFGGGGADCDF